MFLALLIRQAGHRYRQQLEVPRFICAAKPATRDEVYRTRGGRETFFKWR
jgi:hypothetical protein